MVPSRSMRLVEVPACSWPPFPPPGESELDKALRLEDEKEAKDRSDAIDRQLALDKEEMRKWRHHYQKILLLGQAESGKSTLLKTFQMHYTPKAFQAEREAWRAVIHLNLVRSVNFILELLPQGTQSRRAASEESSAGASRLSPKPSKDDLRPLRMRLSPLREVEKILVRRLSADNAGRGSSVDSDENMPGYYGCASEVSIRGGTSWKTMLSRRLLPSQKDDIVNARHILDACRMDIMELWSNPLVHDALEEEGVNLEQQSGFFLDEADRVAAGSYEPSVQDILRCRLRTIGVEEHTLTLETSGRGEKWIFYDVGGALSQRVNWVPYFEEVNATIFLCPMSAFNETLLEDMTVNRLSDSFELWKTICSSKLLQRAHPILLLNKSDILRDKLESGVSFARWVKNYKDQPNDADHVAEYLKLKFAAIHKKRTPRKRHLHVHVTCAIDVSIMTAVLVRIREALIVNNLISSDIV